MGAILEADYHSLSNQKGNIRNVSFPNVNLNKEVNGDKVKLPEIKFTWE